MTDSRMRFLELEAVEESAANEFSIFHQDKYICGIEYAEMEGVFDKDTAGEFARLIAAAPDLLEWIRQGIDKGSAPISDEDFDAYIDKARALIAQIDGTPDKGPDHDAILAAQRETQGRGD